MVERHPRYVMLAKVANKDTQTVISVLIKQAKKLPSELYKSLTWDRGKEWFSGRRAIKAINMRRPRRLGLPKSMMGVRIISSFPVVRRVQR